MRTRKTKDKNFYPTGHVKASSLVLYHQNRLPADERLKVARHLEECLACRGSANKNLTHPA